MGDTSSDPPVAACGLFDRCPYSEPPDAHGESQGQGGDDHVLGGHRLELKVLGHQKAPLPAHLAAVSTAGDSLGYWDYLGHSKQQ